MDHIKKQRKHDCLHIKRLNIDRNCSLTIKIKILHLHTIKLAKKHREQSKDKGFLALMCTTAFMAATLFSQGQGSITSVKEQTNEAKMPQIDKEYHNMLLFY